MTNRLEILAEAIRGAFCDEAGAQREPESSSVLHGEIDAAGSDLQRHFLLQLPNHITMLVMAISDGCDGLANLGQTHPFSSMAVARAVLEAAGDLHWLAAADQTGAERARRAITTYLRQVETTVRQLEQLQKRTAQTELEDGIREGRELLRVTAEEAGRAGYKIGQTRRHGQLYVLDDGKPSTSALVDSVVSHFYGTTGVNLYATYSASAHAEGGGLGALLDDSDRIETTAGRRRAYGLPTALWKAKVEDPVVAVAFGVAHEALTLVLPDQAAGFRKLQSP